MRLRFALQKNRLGFSLIEITITLGILSFAILPLFGLLTVGLQSSRRNVDRSINAQILSWIQGDTASHTETRIAYFDEFGAASSEAAGVYKAVITPTNISLPGSSLSLPVKNVVIHHSASEDRKIDEDTVW